MADTVFADEGSLSFEPVVEEKVKAAADETIQKGEMLNLERCINIALRRQPNILAAAGMVEVNRNRVGEAKSTYYPQIAANAGYSRIKPLTGAQALVITGISGTTASAPTSAFDQYSGSVTLNQYIYDFGKTPTQVNISRLNLDSAGQDFENISEQTILSVKQGYYAVLQAKRNRAVAQETVKQFAQHLDQAKGFYEVGTHPKFDVTKAEVDLSNAKLNLIRAENTVRLAIVNLNNAMGVPDAPDYQLEDNLSFVKYEMAFEEALSTAFANRPDLKSAIAKRKAAEQAIALAKTGYYPVISGNAAYNVSGSNFPLNTGWNVGATISIPIFSGFLTKYQVEEARANLNVLKANEETQRLTVFLDIQQAYLNLREAEERVPTAELAVTQAKENLDIANGRYSAGVGSPIEVTDAQVAYTNAETTYIQALSDYKVARAALEKAMGSR
jgi:outer membrane protein TolC